MTKRTNEPNGVQDADGQCNEQHGEDDIISQLKTTFSGLSPQLKNAARYAIDNPSDIAVYSMRDVAKRAGVKHSAMVRLARELGFDGYDAFRNLFRDIITQPTDALWLSRAQSIRDRFPAGSDDAILGEHLLLEMENLQQTFGESFAGNLKIAVARLRKAKKVYVLGLRSMFPLAYSFHYAFRMFGTESVLITGLGGALADDLRAIGPEDVLLVFSFRPYAKDAVNAVEFAVERAGQLVVVTDSEVSPVVTTNGCNLIVASNSISLFPSVTSAIAVSQLIITMLFSEGENVAMLKLNDAQTQLDQFKVYIDHKNN